MKIPLKISPCPITEAIFELRFTPSGNPDAVFPLVYGKFIDEFPEIVQLPALQIPKQFRDQDPTLQYHAHRRLLPAEGSKYAQQGFQIALGPRSISVAQVGEYIGWRKIEPVLKKVFGKISDIGLTSAIERTGLRYLNVFEDQNIFDFSTLKVSLDGREQKISSSQLQVLTESDWELGKYKVSVANPVEVEKESKQIHGSLIDIDILSDNVDSNKVMEVFRKSHEQEKYLFFSLLSDEYIKTLNPEY